MSAVAWETPASKTSWAPSPRTRSFRTPHWGRFKAADWDRISPFTLGRGGSDGSPPPPPADPKRRRRHVIAGTIVGLLVLAIVVFLLIFDWNMLRGPIGRYASARTGRTVELTGDLKVKLLTWTPRVDVGGLKVGNPKWGPKANMAEVGNIAVSAKLLPLLSGRVILPLVQVDRPDVKLLRDAQGRANWELEPRGPSKPLQLPLIQRFLIKDGKIRFNDVAKSLNFAGTINAEETAGAGGRGFSLTGRGDLNRRAFLLNVTGGPLINVQRDKPYPFDADIRAGATHVTAKGQVPKPFDLGLITADLSVSGRDMNDLYYLTGLALPNTPPYTVRGALKRDGTVYTYNGFKGRVGRSDLSGDMKADLTSGRPMLSGKLHSRLLDFADLAGLFGAPGASAAATGAQKAEVDALAAQGRFLPDATLQVDRIRAMDAKVEYTAANVRAPNLPLEGVKLGVDLDKGVLKLNPIEFAFPSGRLMGNAELDARKDTPVTKVDLRVSNVRIEEFTPAQGGVKPLSGLLLGRAQLTGAGDSVHRAAAASNGGVTVVIPRGQIRKAFAELLGVNAAKGLFLLLSKDQSPSDIRCAIGDFVVRDGTMIARKIVFDTGPVIVTGEGTINLENERMDMTFKGKPKKLRVVRVIAPLTVGGQMRAPRFGIEPAGAIAQAGLGAVLGTVLTPLAAILPFVDPGLAKNADCSALLAEARDGAAKVSVPKTVTTTAIPRK